MMQEHILKGCRTTPLASYLKALAVLRLVSEQIDRAASGYWQEEVFVLRSRLTKEELAEFFIDRYRPTPLVSPWNRGSGFYPKDNQEGIEGIEKSSSRCFAEYRNVISIIRENSGSFLLSDDNPKESILAAVRSRLPGESLSWIDSSFVVKTDGNPKYNPLLGTGGNEGRLDFTNNFMRQLVQLFIKEKQEKVKTYLKTAIFDDVCSGFQKTSIGQFDPGRAGGYNQGAEVETKDFKINPWNFILMLEGATMFSSSVTRRGNNDRHQWASIPFTVSCTDVGFSSSVSNESGRSEMWLPIWNNAATLPEVRHVFSEGRGSLGRKQAGTGLEFSRAISSLGVDKGIDGFIRYTFLERRGQSYVALPAGRLSVKYNPAVHLLEDLDPILEKLDRFLRQFVNPPAAFESARRQIDEAMYACAVDPANDSFLRMVRALGRMEFLVAQRDRSKDPKLNRPLSGLRPVWIDKCDHPGVRVEVRIAAALASIHGTGKVGPIRSNMAGVDAQAPYKWATGNGQKRWRGNSLTEWLAGVLSQRMMDATRLNSENTIPAQARLSVTPHDVIPFLYGETDDHLMEDLLWGFSLIDWRKKEQLETLRHAWRESSATERPLIPRPWALCKLLFDPWWMKKMDVRPEPRVLALLNAGKAPEAVDVALKRLKVSDLENRSPLPVEDDGWIEAERMAASLLIPVSQQYLLEKLVTENKKTD